MSDKLNKYLTYKRCYHCKKYFDKRGFLNHIRNCDEDFTKKIMGVVIASFLLSNLKVLE